MACGIVPGNVAKESVDQRRFSHSCVGIYAYDRSPALASVVVSISKLRALSIAGDQINWRSLRRFARSAGFRLKYHGPHKSHETVAAFGNCLDIFVIARPLSKSF